LTNAGGPNRVHSRLCRPCSVVRLARRCVLDRRFRQRRMTRRPQVPRRRAHLSRRPLLNNRCELFGTLCRFNAEIHPAQ
jgi:hypothetical protein